MKSALEYKLSVCIRINGVTPAHAYLSLFMNMIPSEQEHEQATRALAGTFTVSNDELLPFLLKLDPHILMISEQVNKEALEEYTGVNFDRLVAPPEIRVERLGIADMLPLSNFRNLYLGRWVTPDDGEVLPPIEG